MLYRSTCCVAVLLGLLFVIFVQSESTRQVSRELKTKLPSMGDEEASQWLSTQNIPSRWRHHHTHRPSNEIGHTLKQLQAVNDNGVRQFDMQSFEGVSMEVIFEMVYKQQYNKDGTR